MTFPLFNQSTLPLWDLDSTQLASYSGAGTVWYNLVTNPADGLAQSAYDFNVVGTPTFTGAAGSSGAYWAMDGASYFQIAGGNTNILKQLAQVYDNNGTFAMFNQATIIVALRTDSVPSMDVDICGTEGNSGGVGNYGGSISFKSTPVPAATGPAVNYIQVLNSVSNVNGVTFPNSLPWVPVASTDYLIPMGFGSYTDGGELPSQANFNCTINNRDFQNGQQNNGVIHLSAVDATHDFCIGSAGNGTPVTTGYRIYGCYGFGKLLTNDEYSAFVDVLNARQGNRWAF